MATIGSRHLVRILLVDSKVLSGHDGTMAILDCLRLFREFKQQEEVVIDMCGSGHLLHRRQKISCTFRL